MWKRLVPEVSRRKSLAEVNKGDIGNDKGKRKLEIMHWEGEEKQLGKEIGRKPDLVMEVKIGWNCLRGWSPP